MKRAHALLSRALALPADAATPPPSRTLLARRAGCDAGGRRDRLLPVDWRTAVAP